MLLSFFVLYGWILTIVVILAITIYFENRNYYLGFGYFCIIEGIFLIVTCWFLMIG